jgi:B12-binding domain/radical SAM domain protein of rhizo-twelve system
MRVALVNPRWSYEGSIYFGCRSPHLPLELGYARELLEADGHEVTLVDAHAEDEPDVGARVAKAAPELVVVTTAPTYLFWRCPPPELRVPAAAVRAIRAAVSAPVVAVGPHGSTSPETTLAKLGVDAVVRGECEEVIATLARTPRAAWSGVTGVHGPKAHDREEVPAEKTVAVAPAGAAPAAADLAALPALHWRPEELRRHAHHHHRFDVPAPEGLGAEVEASRGCPFTCSFCAKTNHRDRYRRRPLDTIAAELDALVAAGVTYVYFVDELFLPWSELVALLASRPLSFGIQTRIDLWRPEELDALGHAGCVSIEAGIESVSIEGRQALDKRCRLDTFALSERLIRAKATVPFVQATLMDSRFDTPETVARWRDLWKAEGIWVNEPVPLFPYPGSPDYTRLWGAPDERAWERAHDHYLGRFDAFSDIQDERPVRLPILEEAP